MHKSNKVELELDIIEFLSALSLVKFSEISRHSYEVINDRNRGNFLNVFSFTFAVTFSSADWMGIWFQQLQRI